MEKISLLHAFVLIPLITSCYSSKNLTNNTITFANNEVIAHRGAWKKNNLPENSIASLRAAIALKCYGSEFDVRMTSDDSLIINHDPHYHNLPVELTSYANLSVFKLSNGEKLPTLREYILAGLKNNTSTRLICEIKPSEVSKDRGKNIAAKAVNLIHSLNAQHMVVYISFDYDILKKIIEIDPKAITQYLEGNKSPDALKADKISGADYHLSVYKNHPEWIESARKNNIILNAWTVNQTSEIDWLLAHGFNFITTNEPELLFERIKISPTTSGWNLTWSDEFNYNGMPDSTKWGFEEGGNGWGNNELQYYTKADTLNTKVANGLLYIIAHNQPKVNNQYTSARLTTQNKATFQYGRIEVMARLPKGRGLWPAIWMLGENRQEVGWPMCGEIDIMEHVGFEPDSVFGTIHTNAYNHIRKTQKGKKAYIENPYDEFNLYVIEWTPDKIDFLLNDKIYNQILNEHKSKNEWPFDQPFYLILNVAVGGGLGGKQGIDETIFPSAMEIDYVRVFTKQN